ncbi:MAG: hypothetical protein A3D92_04910 [Bacteroidetes bacterium RIFCSPHIGHO2_02_FULL_44_7]|nr:MAG: hypothetical protein A3D92_04910 [Bacteroidetes bacterium RIFCSPHIGHO2_02_FULL_44_7]
MEKLPIEEFIQWDVRTWSRALKYWDTQVAWNTIENALELGAREGGLSLWLASKGKRVLCTDYEDAEKIGRPLHEKHGLTSLVAYENVDATKIPYTNHFDLIVFKSIIGGIGRFGGIDAQRQVFLEIHKALKPGGVLLFAENMQSSALHQRLRKRHNAWGNYWRYVSLKELSEFLEPFSLHTLKTTGFYGTLGRSEAQKRLFSRMDELGPNALFPASWKYLGYGIAVK